MTVEPLLDDLRDHGVEVIMTNGRLTLRGDGHRPRDLINRVRERAREIAAFLASTASASFAYRDYYEERAAIGEHDAKLPRAVAERLARLHCRLEWAARYPPPDPGANRCCHCQDLVLNGGRAIQTARWARLLHLRCASAFATARRSSALAALADAGIPLDD